MKRPWLISIIVLAVAVIGMLVYEARQHADESGNAQPNQAATPVQPAAEPGTAPSTLAACVGPMNSQTSKADLAARHKWADALLVKNHTDAALAELRNIAALNPGYPGVNLEISDTLLKSKHANEARDAIKLQLEISGCLSNLPPADVQAYCESEWVSMPQGKCAQELAKINQQAHYEAGLIDAGMQATVDSHTPRQTIGGTAPPPPRAPTQQSVSPAAGASSATQEVAAAPSPSETVAPKPPPPPVIQSSEASEHIGQRATVCGVVVSKNTSEQSNGKPTFVNLDRSFPQQTFTVVIWGKDSPAVGDFPATGKVCVTGTIETYRGNPQIALHDAKGWYRSDQP